MSVANDSRSLADVGVALSARASGWVWHSSKSAGNDRLVLLAIADECDHWGRNAYPGIERLVRMTKVDRSTVYRCISRLTESGELTIESEGGGRGKRTIYSLPKMPAETVAICDIPTAKPSQNSGETVAIPSHAQAQNADTLTPTHIRTRNALRKRTPAQIESDRRYGGEGARFPETTPEYMAEVERKADLSPLPVKPVDKETAKKARELMKVLKP